MKISLKLLATVSAIAATGTVGLVGSAAQAATQHCPGKTDPSKVELDGRSSSYVTSFTSGTVCIKAGNVVFEDVAVGEDGLIVSPNGKGISYFVCDDPYGCNGGGGSSS